MRASSPASPRNGTARRSAIRSSSRPAEQPDHRPCQRHARRRLRHHGRPRPRTPRPPRPRHLRPGLLAAAIVVPGVVIGIATLVALVAVFGAINPALPQSGRARRRRSSASAHGSIIAAHGLFTMALVTMIVKARIATLGRDIVEASADLYATPLTTFGQIVLPQILPSVLAGFLLAFTFSFDDFIVAFFVAGSKTTLPIYVFASIRRGVTPEVNAIATLVLVASLMLILIARLLMRKRPPNELPRGGETDDPEEPCRHRHRSGLRHRPGRRAHHGARRRHRLRRRPQRDARRRDRRFHPRRGRRSGSSSTSPTMSN